MIKFLKYLFIRMYILQNCLFFTSSKTVLISQWNDLKYFLILQFITIPINALTFIFNSFVIPPSTSILYTPHLTLYLNLYLVWHHLIHPHIIAPSYIPLFAPTIHFTLPSSRFSRFTYVLYPYYVILYNTSRINSMCSNVTLMAIYIQT